MVARGLLTSWSFFREDILDAYIFDSIQEVKQLSEEWMEDYNKNHPHVSLIRISPIDYAENFFFGSNLPKKKSKTK